MAQAIAPHATADQTVLMVGEGGGAIVARRAIEPPTVVAESNTLPVRASLAGPGAVSAVLKPGGVLIAVLPPTPPGKARVAQLVGDVWPRTDVWPYVDVWPRTDVWPYVDVWPRTDVWPYVDVWPRTDVWPYVTVTDMVWTTVLTSYDALEGAAAGVIPELDAELLALRRAFGSREPRGCQHFSASPGSGLDPETTSPGSGAGFDLDPR